MLLTNEVPHVNGGKLMSFDCVICLGLLGEGGGGDPVTNWQGWDSHKETNQKISFPLQRAT